MRPEYRELSLNESDTHHIKTSTQLNLPVFRSSRLVTQCKEKSLRVIPEVAFKTNRNSVSKKRIALDYRQPNSAEENHMSTSKNSHEEYYELIRSVNLVVRKLHKTVEKMSSSSNENSANQVDMEIVMDTESDLFVFKY